MPSLPRLSPALLGLFFVACGVERLVPADTSTQPDVSAVPASPAVPTPGQPANRIATDSGLPDRGEVPDAGANHMVPVEPDQPGEPDHAADAGAPSEPDGGSQDAGELRDAGPQLADGLDAGAPLLELVDAGQAPVDAGTERIDTGPPSSDAGSPLVDADAGLTADAGPADAGTTGAIDPHVPFGRPDDSTVGRLDRWLLVKPQFVGSYDTLAKTPRWVAWRLDSTWLGSATRATSFRRDVQLPTMVGQARDDDFRNSGFDRGHLCPSADRTRTDPDNDATFVFTNVVPQTRASNAGTWLSLEDDARGWAQAGKTLLIVAGPIFGVTPERIGTGVPVPLSTFKVVVMLDTPGQAISAQTRVIGVIVPNTTTVSGDWRAHRVSVRSIEQLTGLDFLSELPRPLQETVETRVDALP